MKRTLLVLATVAVGVIANATQVIDFGGLSGNNLDPFSTYQEDGYQVDSVGGQWFEGHVFGNPVPSLVCGPVFNPVASTIKVTRLDASAFQFLALDASSNTVTGDGILVEGYLNNGLVLSIGGSIPGVDTFFTGVNALPNVLMDTMYVTIRPVQGSTSANLDNIELNAVPEPATMTVITLGVAALARRRRKA